MSWKKAHGSKYRGQFQQSKSERKTPRKPGLKSVRPSTIFVTTIANQARWLEPDTDSVSTLTQSCAPQTSPSIRPGYAHALKLGEVQSFKRSYQMDQFMVFALLGQVKLRFIRDFECIGSGPHFNSNLAVTSGLLEQAKTSGRSSESLTASVPEPKSSNGFISVVSLPAAACVSGVLNRHPSGSPQRRHASASCTMVDRSRS